MKKVTCPPVIKLSICKAKCIDLDGRYVQIKVYFLCNFCSLIAALLSCHQVLSVVLPGEMQLKHNKNTGMETGWHFFQRGLTPLAMLTKYPECTSLATRQTTDLHLDRTDPNLVYFFLEICSNFTAVAQKPAAL